MNTKNIFTACIVAIVTMLWANVLNAQVMEKNESVPQGISIFPVGNPNDAYSQYFVGKSYLAPVVNNDELKTHISNVTFEPACRNNWHSHTGGQILIAVGGRGFYQEKGKPAQLMLPGDVVEIAPNVVHWHGAAPDSWYSHLAVECNGDTNKNTWLDPVTDEEYVAATAVQDGLTDVAAANISDWYAGAGDSMAKTDPELWQIFNNFAFGDVQQYGKLDIRTRILVTLASLVAQNTVTEFRKVVNAALSNGITPDEVKEVLYHAVPYCGMPRVEDLLAVANDIFAARGIELPLPRHSIVTQADRYEKGLELQVEIFGERMRDSYKNAPADQAHIQQYLSANCFGDYQTRPVFDKKMRELLTFSVLISLGGCEPQVKAHITGNVNLGNGKDVLLATATQLLPYLGYPRTLNAIACINEVIPESK